MFERYETMEIMRLMWHDEKNKTLLGKTFDQITVKDSSMAIWKCPYENSPCPLAIKSPKQIYQAIYHGSSLCGYCKGNTFEGSIQNIAPDKIKSYWHFDRNSAIGIYPDKKTSNSNTMVYVKCDKHNWGINEEQKQRCADLSKHIPCPQCNGNQASCENNLKVKFPAVSKEIHPAYNPELILPYSSDKYPWWCELCDDFYIKEVRLRTSQHQGCPIHNSLHKWSKTEGLLLLIFNKVIGGFNKHELNDLKWPSGHKVEIDLYKQSLKIAIEYDGYQHEDRAKSDQDKNDMLYGHKDISLFIRIREKGLEQLNYHERQFAIECEKHESSYNFLIPAIQEALQIIIKECNLSVKAYSDEEITQMIKELLPKISGNSTPLSDGETFAEYAPGLLRYLDSKNKNPYTVRRGSNHVFDNVTCPNCDNVFSNHKSIAKILIESKGRCNKCLLYVEDIHKENSPLIRWYPRTKFEKSLEGRDPILAKFYSKNNLIPANEVAYKGSDYQSTWKCPYCFRDYESTNYIQVNNGCKCWHCWKKALEFAI